MYISSFLWFRAAKLAKELKIYLAEASRVLIELTKRKLAICLTPNLLSGRVYDLTEEGKKIKDKIKN